MRSMVRSVVLGAVLLGLTTGYVAAQANPFVGTWKMNVAKWAGTPGPAPKAVTVKVEAVGKLFIEHYFPREFEKIIMRSLERKCGHSKIELEVLGIDHTQIGAAVCDVLKVDPQIINAVWSHHNPLYPMIPEDPVEAGSFLPACVALADALANMGQLSLGGEKQIDTPFQSLPEWVFLNSFEMVYGLELDLQKEISQATEDLKAFQ